MLLLPFTRLSQTGLSSNFGSATSLSGCEQAVIPPLNPRFLFHKMRTKIPICEGRIQCIHVQKSFHDPAPLDSSSKPCLRIPPPLQHSEHKKQKHHLFPFSDFAQAVSTATLLPTLSMGSLLSPQVSTHICLLPGSRP